MPDKEITIPTPFHRPSKTANNTVFIIFEPPFSYMITLTYELCQIM